MLATMLVATHSHSPWSSLPRERICRVPPGSVLCLLLLGFPTLGKERAERERKDSAQQRAAGQGEAAAGSLSYLRCPGDTAGHRQGIRALRSWQGRRFPRFREDLGGNARGIGSGGCCSALAHHGKNPTAPARTHLRHPKLKPLREGATRHPQQNPLPGWGRHGLPQEMPKLPLSLRQRQRRGRTLRIRGLGPVGMWEDGERGGAWSPSGRAGRWVF